MLATIGSVLSRLVGHVSTRMQRLPEPELMRDVVQVMAYAAADFSAGDQRTLALIDALFTSPPTGTAPAVILDLGCGPGNITLPLARRFPGAQVIGVDGSPAMLAVARERADQQGLQIDLRCSTLQGLALEPVDLIVSNSLLHHLHEPDLLWRLTRRFAAPGCRVLHRDLRRPVSLAEVHRLQQLHCPDAPAVLIQDFCASLVAAFTPEEVRQQLAAAGLDALSVEAEDDRYLVVSGLVD